MIFPRCRICSQRIGIIDLLTDNYQMKTIHAEYMIDGVWATKPINKVYWHDKCIIEKGTKTREFDTPC